MKYRIAIVDDKKQNRVSLAQEINYSNQVNVVFTANNGEDYLEQLKQTPVDIHPQVVLMDIDMPVMNGIDAVRISSLLFPDIQYIMLTVFDDDDKIFQAIQAGANGYLLKEERGDTILNAVKELTEKQGAPMSPAIARRTLVLLSQQNQSSALQNMEAANPNLSERETDILKNLVRGMEYKQIAANLFISPHTVRNHIAHIYEKLHITSKTQAIALAHKNKWV